MDWAMRIPVGMAKEDFAQTVVDMVEAHPDECRHSLVRDLTAGWNAHCRHEHNMLCEDDFTEG